MLISYRITWKEKVEHPYGKTPKGYLIYTPENFVSVHIMRSNRPKCSSADFRNLSHKEMEEIVVNSGGYVGRFEIKPPTIIHTPLVSTYPNFLFEPQIREGRFEGDKLILECEYPKEYNGYRGRSQLDWEKVQG